MRIKMLSEPLSTTFKHRQTTANQVRFTTVPLSEMETKILNAGGRAIEIEKRLYDSLKDAILAKSAEVSQAARARWRNWISQPRWLIWRQGRTGAVPRLMPAVPSRSGADGIRWSNKPCGRRRVRRSSRMTVTSAMSADIWLLTGPNMAGKSTYLRQNALIALLAQMGSFVPAQSAHIGLVSQLFSRVGASDDLARGRSTFMVEMVETAAILNQADDHALVILDEIGRGTATYDGLSIAWATLEHLHDVNGCRALFATHYHEMTNLSDKLDKVENATVTVKEHDGEVVFLHEVRKGAADRSYGVQVAKLAGLPDAVVARARVVLDALEKGEREGGTAQKALIDDLPLFRCHTGAAARTGENIGGRGPAGGNSARRPDRARGAEPDLRAQGFAEMKIHPDMGIPLPDGTRLSARVWMPDRRKNRACSGDTRISALSEIRWYSGAGSRDAPAFCKAWLRVSAGGSAGLR